VTGSRTQLAVLPSARISRTGRPAPSNISCDACPVGSVCNACTGPDAAALSPCASAGTRPDTPRLPAEPHVADGEFAWLVTGGPCGHRELGLDPEDFDVIYAYPWPDEERLTADLFARVARPGAVLATYHGEGAVRLRKKTGKAPGRR
jgi:hypothetical protein